MVERSYVFVGAGAIGGTVAHAMAAGGIDVTVVDAAADHVAAIRAGGLRVRQPDGSEKTVRIKAFTPDDYDGPAGSLQRVVVATKSQHTHSAAEWIAERLHPDGRVISLQNGENEPTIEAAVGKGKVVSAFVNIFSDYLEPGVVSFGGRGALVLGMPDGGAPDAFTLDSVVDMRHYGPVKATANVRGFRFAKRGFTGILEMTTLVDAPMADVVAAHGRLAAHIAEESTEVAIRTGVALEEFDGYEPYAFSAHASSDVRAAALERLTTYLRGQPKNRSGIFRDIAVRKRPIESDALEDEAYGDLARSCGVDVTASTRLSTMLSELSRGEREFGDQNLMQLENDLLSARD